MRKEQMLFAQLQFLISSKESIKVYFKEIWSLTFLQSVENTFFVGLLRWLSKLRHLVYRSAKQSSISENQIKIEEKSNSTKLSSKTHVLAVAFASLCIMLSYPPAPTCMIWHVHPYTSCKVVLQCPCACFGMCILLYHAIRQSILCDNQFSLIYLTFLVIIQNNFH